MKDALVAAYGTQEPIDYYSYEPFQVYGANAVAQMAWVSSVGDLWRTGGDIRPIWRSILANAHANNKWAPNGSPGHYNDADSGYTYLALPELTAGGADCSCC